MLSFTKLPLLQWAAIYPKRYVLLQRLVFTDWSWCSPYSKRLGRPMLTHHAVAAPRQTQLSNEICKWAAVNLDRLLRCIFIPGQKIRPVSSAILPLLVAACYGVC